MCLHFGDCIKAEIQEGSARFDAREQGSAAYWNCLIDLIETKTKRNVCEKNDYTEARTRDLSRVRRAC